MSARAKYIQGFLLLELDKGYTAEHVVYCLLEKGYFSDWDNLVQAEFRLRFTKALKSIQAFCNSNLLPEQGDLQIPAYNGTAEKPAWLGAKLIARVNPAHLETHQIARLKKAQEFLHKFETNNTKTAKLQAAYPHGIARLDDLFEHYQKQSVHKASCENSAQPENPSPPLDQNQQEEREERSGTLQDSSVGTPTPAQQAEADQEDKRSVPFLPQDEATSPAITSNLPQDAKRSGNDDTNPVIVVVDDKHRTRNILTAFLMIVAVFGLSFATTHFLFKNLPETRNTKGAREVERVIRSVDEKLLSDDVDYIIATLKDEKDLYRFAENIWFNGKVILSKKLFLHLLKTSEDERLLLFIRLYLARIANAEAKYDASEQSIQKLFEDFRNSDYPWYEIHLYILKSRNALFQYDISSARTFIQEAEKRFFFYKKQDAFPTQYDQDVTLAYLRIRMALVELLSGQFPKAKIFLHEANSLFSNIEDNRGSVESKVFIAMTFSFHSTETLNQHINDTNELLFLTGEESTFYLFWAIRDWLHTCNTGTNLSFSPKIHAYIQRTNNVLLERYLEFLKNIPCHHGKDQE
jgi:hypothetical protein